MFEGLIKKIEEAFNFKKAAEEKAKKLNEKRLARLAQQNRENDKIAIEEAKKKLSKIAKEKKKQENRLPYREFKTVLEMVYVEEKARQSGKKWTKEQQKEFNKKFAANLAKCQKNPKFQEEYDLYLKLENGEIVPTSNPQTLREQKITRMYGEILDIQMALWPTAPNNGEYKPEDSELYRRIRFKYEKKLDDNKKESENEKTTARTKRHVISI